jgi:hypothetical protein
MRTLEVASLSSISFVTYSNYIQGSGFSFAAFFALSPCCGVLPGSSVCWYPELLSCKLSLICKF